MKATSITQTTNTMVELITQSLSEKIKETETQIHESLINKGTKKANKERGSKERGSGLHSSKKVKERGSGLHS